MKTGRAITEALQKQRADDIDQAFGVTLYERWFAGPITKFCGHGYHADCARGGAHVSAVFFTVPCLCDCGHFIETLPSAVARVAGTADRPVRLS